MSREVEFTRRTAITSGAAVMTSVFAGCSGGSDSGNDQQDLETTFDEGKEEWKAVDLTPSDADSDPDWSTVIQTLEITHEQDGGVGDSGYVTRTDTTPNSFFFDASDTYLGDKSAYVGGTLGFSIRSTRNNYRQDSAVVFEGPEGVIATKFTKPETDWTQFSIELDAGTRSYRDSNLNGPEVDQERLEAILSDLQALRISGEHGSNVEEEVGLDEVQLRQA